MEITILTIYFIVFSFLNWSIINKETLMDSDEKWKDKLTEEEYKVSRQCGTEPPFSGKYYNHDENGIYRCVCCDAKLFASSTKYDSGSGWPSFYDALDKSAIKQLEDSSLGMKRIEIKCAKCDSHLGHVFPDGPNPTGLRYCVNSLSLDFDKADK